jgi:hypothetical protein
MGFQFNLLGTDYTVDDALATDADTPDMANLHKGDYTTLNLYFVTSVIGGVEGRCTLPGTSDVTLDNCLVNVEALPGGRAIGRNDGTSAVHEVGHWLNLLHTFQGESCFGVGDYVSDTPMQRTPTAEGCPTGKDTCPGGGPDPIHNFMDYSTHGW